MLPSLRGQGAGRSQAFVILGIPGLALVGCTGVTALWSGVSRRRCLDAGQAE